MGKTITTLYSLEIEEILVDYFDAFDVNLKVTDTEDQIIYAEIVKYESN